MKKGNVIIFIIVTIMLLGCRQLIFQNNSKISQNIEGLINTSYTSGDLSMFSQDEKELLSDIFLKIEKCKKFNKNGTGLILTDLSLENCYKVVSYFYMYYGTREAITDVFHFYYYTLPFVEKDIVSIKINYQKIEELEKNLNIVLNKADSILSDLEYENEEELLYEISIYLKDNIDYLLNNYTLYDALLNGKSSCNGYALAFNMLANKSGIKSDICVGQINEGYHAWNRVILSNGEEYFYDVTYFDLDSGNEKYIHSIRHLYIDDYLINAYVEDWFKQ